MLEVSLGNHDSARDLFELSAVVSPSHAPTFTAWAQFEAGQGTTNARSLDTARRLFQQAYAADPTHIPNLHVRRSCSACDIVLWLRDPCVVL